MTPEEYHEIVSLLFLSNPGYNESRERFLDEILIGLEDENDKLIDQWNELESNWENSKPYPPSPSRT